MDHITKELIAKSVMDLHLPEYREIPNVGLYLEQVTKYVAEYLAPLGGITITSSMISNYVKKKIIANPVKKMYDRKQIAHIFFVAVAKSVLPLENIQKLIGLQESCYDCELAYNYFKNELESYVRYVYGVTDAPANLGPEDSDEKMLLRKLIVAIANTNYMETYFRLQEGHSRGQ